MLPALGIPSFDQAARITKLQLQKSIRGNQYVEFETSVRGFHLRPGSIVTLTYLREGLDRTPFRVVRIAPGLNYQTTQITAQRHDDQWYLGASGGGGQSNGREPYYELGLPRPLVGTVIDADGVAQFGVNEKVIETADGGGTLNLEVSFKQPRPIGISRAGIPILALSPSIDVTSGTLRSNQTLYYALSGIDAEGNETSLSFIVRARISGGLDQHSVTLQRLSFSSATSSFNVYRGSNPHQMFRIASAQSLSTTFLDAGLPTQLIGPPDENYSTGNFYWRVELESIRSINIFSQSSIGNDSLSLITNVYKGKLVRIVRGTGSGQERNIAANTATTLNVASPWIIAPDATSEFVVTEPSWAVGASTPTSPAVFEVPNRQGVTIEVSGRAANANGKECSYELSPITRWILGGASGLLQDSKVPGEPVFLLFTNGEGQVYLNSVAFSSLQNTHSIQSGTLTLHFTDELSSPFSEKIAAALDISATTVTLHSPHLVETGQLIQIGGELLTVLNVLDAGLSYLVSRGSFDTQPENHAADSLVYFLTTKLYVVPFARDFFGSPASSSFSYSIDLYSSRLAAAEFFVTNARGNSPISKQNYTATIDFGLRTLSGGQISLQVDGYLSIQDDAAPPINVDSSKSIRDLFAMVNEAPTGSPITVRVRQNIAVLATLTIPVNQTISNVVNGFGLPVLSPGSRLSLDIVSVGSSVDTVPGADLTVSIRL